MDSVKVKIFKSGYIPGIGTGPIRTPTWISRETYEKLKGLGFNIIIVEDPSIKQVSNAPTTTKTVQEKPAVISVKLTETSKEKPVSAAPVKKETPVVEETEATEEDISEEEINDIEETSEDKVLVNDKDFSPDAIYTEEFLTSKNVCKKILNARKIQYNYHALFETLKTLVLESNPKN